ncbi:uncharacterized protein LOC130675321 isoform X2 [Microplitis mediator]|uniref:uncharacterized protein LOC130675321 isoform X2 n=1 Tax=Microplitis mediator TaxID=375433 RepID=UPI00255731C5|nr:uncharacterized protein LOC130675321 isoform X2 [Microplitis mediator]
MFSFQTDMMMIEFLSTFKRRMAKLDKLDNMDCPECSGPPPIFRLPPPPRPPFLTEAAFCSEAPLAELEDCVAIPMIDASYHANPSLQNTALIIACTVILLLMAAIVSVVFWKHKRKVQNLLPCKSAVAVTATTGRTRVLPNGQALTGANSNMMAGNNTARLYEDMMEHVPHSQIHNHLPAQLRMQPTIEMIDVNKEKNGNRGGFVCSSPGPDPYGSQDLYNPVYEELCNGDNQPDTDEEGEINGRNRLHHRASANSKSASEDEFAEDELSVGEPSESRVLTSASPGPVSWSTCPAGSSRTSRERRGKSPRSLDRRRKNKAHDVGEFHEGMLLDALLHFYPNVPGIAGTKNNSSQRTKPAVTVAHKLPYYVPQMPPQFHTINKEIINKEEENPYESVPVLGPLHNYSNQNKTNSKDKSSNKVPTVDDYNKYPQYASEYFGLHNQVVTPIYTQVGNDYSDTYTQPTDKLYYSDDRYAQPVYFTSRDPDKTSAGKLYQGQPDSSFGSDSGYSHHTSGGTTIYNNGGTRSSITRTNHRKDKHRNSNHSHHSVDFIFSQ